LLTEHDRIQFVGVTGLPGSGKGAFIDLMSRHLAEQAVITRYYSLSDELRAEARRRDLPVERPVLRSIGNELRAAQGSGVLGTMVARKALQEITDHPVKKPLVVVIDAIRNPEEVRALQKTLGAAFTLVAIEAPIDTLIERIAARAREDEAAAVMQQQEVARQMILGESGRGEPAHGHQIAGTMALADIHVDNSGDMAALETQANSLVAQLLTSFIPKSSA
jgi:dephospho-CoA kinase